MFTKILILSMAVLISAGCKKEDKAAAAAAAAGDGSLSLADFTGTATSTCISGGGHTGLSSRKQSYTFNTNGTYSFSSTIVEGSTVCALGSTEAIKYFQQGTFAITGTSNGATKVAFTVTSQYLNSYSTTYVNYMNITANCQTPSMGLTDTGTGTTVLSGRSCNSYATFPTNGSVTYNIFTRSGATLATNSGSLVWYPGTSGSYPTTTNLNYSF